jgi:hypothetical protein
MPRKGPATRRQLVTDPVYGSPLVRRTRATLRRAEFGFLGVVV